jgi:uncharacterized protein
MGLPELAALLLVGMLAGVLAGLLGVGGGIIIVPALRFLGPSLGLPDDHLMHIAVATSAAVIIPTSLVSARGHAKRGAIDWSLLKIWGPLMALGAGAAALFGGAISSGGLALIFALVAGLVGAQMALVAKPPALAQRLPAPPIQAGVAGGIGALSALMGIGGGTLSVPTLNLFSYPMHKAVACGAALGVFISLPAFLGWIYSGWGTQMPGPSLGFVNLLLVIVLLPPMLLMAPFGVRLAHKLPAAHLRRVFGVFLIFTSLALATRYL